MLIGKSGCGKTTTLKMLNQLVEPDSGSIQLPDDLSSLPVESMRRRVGYVVQDYGLFPHFTVRQNIAIVPELLSYSEAKLDAAIQKALGLVSLEPTVLNRFPAELSGGQQQRVAVARAIAAQPPLLLMDEPFSALDPMTRSAARASVKQMVQHLQTTTVLVTHDVAEAVELGDRIGLMEDGAFLQVGTPAELLFAPASPAVKGYFREARIECELRAVTMAQLAPFFENSQQVTDTGESVPGTDTAFSAMQALADGSTKTVLWNNGQSISEPAILNALQRYKQEFSSSR